MNWFRMLASAFAAVVVAACVAQRLSPPAPSVDGAFLALLFGTWFGLLALSLRKDDW